MALVAGSGAVPKFKSIIVENSGFTGTGTSVFGAGSDINCTNIEYTQIGLPDKTENEETTFDTNMRNITESAATKKWEPWGKMQVVNDENRVNYKAYVAAQETDATGTVNIKQVVGTATNTIMSFKGKIAGVSGGDGDATSIDTSFTPTYTILEMLSAGTGTATA